MNLKEEIKQDPEGILIELLEQGIPENKIFSRIVRQKGNKYLVGFQVKTDEGWFDVSLIISLIIPHLRDRFEDGGIWHTVFKNPPATIIQYAGCTIQDLSEKLFNGRPYVIRWQLLEGEENE